MSDDEALRRRAPLLAVAAVLLVLGGALWLRGRVMDDATAFVAFCNATHPGEPWEHVQERAGAKGYAFVRQGKAGLPQEEWLAQADFWSYRAGCVVVLERGRVVRTRFAELPSD